MFSRLLVAAATNDTFLCTFLKGDCGACPSGGFCPIGSIAITPCAAGTYFGGSGALTNSSCVICPPGSFCPSATAIPSQCTKGTYLGGIGGGTSYLSCVPCTVGSYCPIGTSVPLSCPVGSFRDQQSGGAVTVRFFSYFFHVAFLLPFCC
jgi:hypothetical protein